MDPAAKRRILLCWESSLLNMTHFLLSDTGPSPFLKWGLPARGSSLRKLLSYSVIVLSLTSALVSRKGIIWASWVLPCIFFLFWTEFLCYAVFPFLVVEMSDFFCDTKIWPQEGTSIPCIPLDSPSLVTWNSFNNNNNTCKNTGYH